MIAEPHDDEATVAGEDEAASDAAVAPGGGGDASPAGLMRFATPNAVVVVMIVFLGVQLGLSPLHDNSFFTHLATGRLILDGAGIPRSDPYSWTALGEPWVVQSWGASVLFAGADRAVGLVGIRVLVTACAVCLGLLTWRLARPAGSVVTRLVVAVPVLVVGAGYWVERPLLFGMIFLGVCLLGADGQLDPRWLVPVMWLWVNIHGSFPLGIAAIGCLLVGRLADRERPLREIWSLVEARCLAWAMGGFVLGFANPLGWRLLWFPVDLLSRREAFSRVVEWQPPTWTSWSERAFALQLVLCVVVFVLRGRSWRLAVPTVVFGGMALMSTRNIAQASFVLLPVMAAPLAGLGSLDGARPIRLLRPVVAVTVALVLAAVALGLGKPDTDLSDYPVESARWMVDEGLLGTDTRVVTRDFVGNYLEVAYGPDEVRVFMDDRVDMYPIDVIADYTTFLDPDGEYASVLQRREVSAVLWDADSDFGRWIEGSADWDVIHRSDDDVWVVAVPAGS